MRWLRERDPEPITFDLSIDRVNDHFIAKVDGQKSTFPEPFTTQELEAFWHGLEDERAAPDRARELGAKLFRAVFSGDVHVAYKAGLAAAKISRARLRVRLRLGAPELAAYPWEYLYDPGAERFLFRSGRSSILRFFESAPRRKEILVSGPLRILLLTSNTPGAPPLDVDQEADAIREALKCLLRSGSVVIERLDRPTLAEIEERFQSHEYHVVHFLGHGGFAATTGGEIYLVDEHGDRIGIDYDLIGEFLSHKSLRLVILNSCEGARTLRENPFSGVAQRLIRKGVPAVIAMQCSVDDAMAIAFSRSFYGALATTGRPGQALARTRRRLLAENYRNGWGVPALYLQAEQGQLFAPPLWCVPKKLFAAVFLLFVGIVLGVWWIDRHAYLNPRECPSPPGLDMKLALIPAGSFDLEVGKDGQTQKVAIPRPFCMGVYEVTAGQWSRTMSGESAEVENEALPATRKSWDDVQGFLKQLDAKAHSRRPRLPTETEWEYAARAGKSSEYSFGDDVKMLPKFGNCKEGDRYQGLAPVGSFRASPWGLYDMHGNVQEWVAGEDLSKPPEVRRIRKGGGYSSAAGSCGSGHRSIVSGDTRYSDTGFRIVLDPL